MANVYNSQLDAFTLYHKVQEQNSSAIGAGSVGLPALGHALAGSTGTAISHLVLYPLDLVVTRLQVQRQLRGPFEAPSAAGEADVEYKNLQDAAQKIYNKEGGLKRQQTKKGTSALPIIDELAVGIGAGAFSKFITTPIQQIVTRKQTAALVAARDPTASVPASQTDKLSMKDIALQIRSERGLQGFWAGYSASVILTLNPALTFLLHNLLKRTMLPKSKRDDPGARLTFLIAAVSKAIATAVTYPFSLAKTRAQSPEYLEKPDLDTPRPVYKASRYAKKAVRVIFYQQLAQLAVLRSLRHIYRTEGFAALYSGLEGEVLKGFLGHGLTMLLKESVHKLIIQVYYSLLGLTKRWPAELGSIKDQAAHELQRVRSTAGNVAQDASERAGGVAQNVTSYASTATERAKRLSESVAESAKSAVSRDD
ncbi:hypothetical protein H2203_004336 [Taxawa tesnikishii (nom. ined.)]|nr:hypothetical protein H2203_004336 [Dothideales sp. JES 119]